MRVLQRALRTRSPLLCISMGQCAVSVAMAVGSAREGERPQEGVVMQMCCLWTKTCNY